MNKFKSFMRSVPKRVYALFAVAVATLVVPAALNAWGPSNRATFTMEQPASYVTFNSITNNPKHGDERNFVQIRNYTDNTKFGEETVLQAGKEYEVYVYYHNNASTTLNDAAHNYAGIANGSFMRIEMPANVPAGSSARVTGYVGATNANPAQVWDEAYAKNSTAGGVALRYVAGSAKINSNGAVNGSALPNTLFTTGTALGYNALDGKLPGCGEFAGYVTFRFVADQPNFEITKQVSKSGANQFGEEVTVNAGDEVQYKIQYKNTGTVQQDGVVIRDVLPAGLEYVNDSTHMANSKTNGQWTKIAENTITKQGINIGSYAPNGNAYIVFKAKVVDASKLVCGLNTITNTAFADTQNGSKSDTAIVKVTKECEEQPKEIVVCRLSDKKYPVTIKESEFDSTKYSKNPEDCKEVVKPEEMTVCVIATKDYPVIIKKSEFDSTKHSTNPADCQEKPVKPTPPTTPTTPTELPRTGITDAMLQVVGAGSLVAAAYYYVASRHIA